MMVVAWGDEIAPCNEEERVLLSPLLAYLRQTRRVRPDTIVRTEFPWHGRRIDVTTLTSTLGSTAYELKLASNRRAIEQAAYNRLSFDRSWVVTASTPGSAAVADALAMGVGIMRLRNGTMDVIAPPRLQARQSSIVRARLLRAMRGR